MLAISTLLYVLCAVAFYVQMVRHAVPLHDESSMTAEIIELFPDRSDERLAA
jgi:hypothetical protein